MKSEACRYDWRSSIPSRIVVMVTKNLESVHLYWEYALKRNNLIEFDDVVRMLKLVTSSASYWEHKKKKLLANQVVFLCKSKIDIRLPDFSHTYLLKLSTLPTMLPLFDNAKSPFDDQGGRGYLWRKALWFSMKKPLRTCRGIMKIDAGAVGTLRK